MSGQNQRGEEDARVVRTATFKVLGPGAAGQPISVHFNPESLEYTVTNNIKEEGNSTENKQQVSKSSGRLSMDLLFDTTLTGSDVRELTESFQAMMKPVDDDGKKIAPVVEFAWGTYRFRGIFTSYKETIDYFSASGVPLRASINLSMSQQDGLFDPTAKGDAPLDDSEVFQPAVDGPATGDPETDRDLAAANGEENPRFFSGNALNLPSGPNLQPPAAFASGGLSLGISANVGFGVDVGFSAGVSAGIGIGIGVGVGIDVGISASFDLDIGIGLSLEANVTGLPSVDARGASSNDTFAAGASAATAVAAVDDNRAVPSGPAISSASASTSGGAVATEATPVFGAFGGGEFVRSGPQAPVRTRVRGPGAASAIDDTFEELPLGPRFGGLAAAGVPAALGAFAGLRPVPPRRRKPISLAELQGLRPERQLRTDAGANFEIGGRAIDRVSRGLSADVGAQASLSDRITFDNTSD